MKYYILAFKNYFNFSGRSRRMEYWMFLLFNIIISSILEYFQEDFGLSPNGDANSLTTYYQIIVLIPSLSLAVRRMHDVNKSGWYLLIPFYNLILALTEGDTGSNKYGPDPKNPDITINDHLVN